MTHTVRSASNLPLTNDSAAAVRPVTGRRPGGRWWLMLVLTIAAGLIALFFKLGDYRLLTQHETFVAVPARAMLENGDLVVPDFAGMPRLQKPPLAYWLVAAISSVTGEVTAVSARLPSAFSGVALAALIGWWAARWYGREVGLAAAAVQLSSVYLINFSRQATVDMLLCLLCTAACFLAADQRPDEPRGRAKLRWTAIYALLSLSVLAKVIFGPLTVLPVCFVFFLVRRRYRDIRLMLYPPGLVLLAASLVIWPYFVLQRVPDAWEVWQTHILGRAAGQLGTQPFWYYVPAVLAQLLPWTPLLLGAIPGSWRRAWRDKDPREQFLWIWFLVPLAIINLSAFKHFHYAIVSLPAASLLVGRHVVYLLDKHRLGLPMFRRVEAGGLLLFVSAAALGGGFGMAARYPYLANLAALMGSLVGLAGIAAVVLLVGRRPTSAAVTLFAAFACLTVIAHGWIFPARDNRADMAHFAKSVHQQFPQPRSVCVFGLWQHEVIYFLDGSAFRLEQPEQLAQRLHRDQRLLVITDIQQIDSLEQLGHVRRLQEQKDLPDTPPPKDAPLVLVELCSPHAASVARVTR